jgi:hypothetical protein
MLPGSRGEPRPPEAQAIRFLHKFAGSHFCHTASGWALKPSNLPSCYAQHACKGRLSTTHSGAAVVLTRQCGGCSGQEAVGSSVLSVPVLGTGRPSSSVFECIGKAYKRSRSPLPNDVFEPRFHSETTRCPARHGKGRRGSRNFPSTPMWLGRWSASTSARGTSARGHPARGKCRRDYCLSTSCSFFSLLLTRSRKMMRKLDVLPTPLDTREVGSLRSLARLTYMIEWMRGHRHRQLLVFLSRTTRTDFNRLKS